MKKLVIISCIFFTTKFVNILYEKNFKIKLTGDINFFSILFHSLEIQFLHVVVLCDGPFLFIFFFITFVNKKKNIMHYLIHIFLSRQFL